MIEAKAEALGEVEGAANWDGADEVDGGAAGGTVLPATDALAALLAHPAATNTKTPSTAVGSNGEIPPARLRGALMAPP